MTAAFTAAEYVAALDYNLAPFVDASGTIPEPTDRAIVRFRNAYLAFLGLDPHASEEERQARAEEMSKASEEEQAAHLATLRAMLAEVCAGHPTTEQIDALPYRVVLAMVSWLLGVLANPQKPAPATSS